ncbi:gene transfer agent family protein [Chelatococcus sp. SYSU_G07232]|uniref:Gene transfer agent family protein n=1 Tax=Chelatococcus albus TaxID=3047466 RepID=A0ABT7AK93_9HYPH|nr:gene transfer agent family protein [Chelatococcus sp. SYSU_G07232]MDJ1159026.1 gene transfer agent family protein [Chelatococcus sp. SYSU_G07232]
MANRHRGEVEAVLGGRRFTLCLTLGALAELEAAFAADNLPALCARLAEGAPSTRDLIRILAAGIRGGGTALTDAEVAALPAAGELEACMRAAVALLAATFGGGEDAANP